MSDHPTPCQALTDHKENMDRYIAAMNGNLNRIWAKLDRLPIWATLLMSLLTGLLGVALAKAIN
jgi:hypothetical protein